jgi:hypothetical protein
MAGTAVPSVTPFFLFWLWIAAVSVVMLRLPSPNPGLDETAAGRVKSRLAGQ